ncbi:MAG: PepSY-like domain-containing protein, partial [Muribaculaceae bacterium]|nr:PepSY-like domain-containing protein [Muribaculaceae bacterium]
IMKLLKLALIAAALGAPAVASAQVMPQGGPGIAVAASVDQSTLPKDAKDFIARHYPDAKVASIEKNFLRTEYDVRPTNGVEIEFNGKGHFRQISAPRGTVLPEAVVKAILPHKAYQHLKDNNLAGYVDEIDRDGRGYDVGLILETPDEVTYTIVGEFVEFDD